MKKTTKRARNLLKQIDAFGQPILISYRGKTEYRTWFGGSLTLILFLVLGGFTFEAIISLLRRENIKVAFSQIYQVDAPAINLNINENFNLAFGFDVDAFNNWTRPHFKISAIQKSIRRLPNGTKLAKEQELELTPCQERNFPKGYDLVKNKNENWYCIKDVQNIILQGRYESDVFSYLKIGIDRCVNNSQTVCAPAEESEALFKKNKVYAKFLFSNKKLNLQEPDQRILNFLESSVFFLLDPSKFYKQADIFLQLNKIEVDDNLWYFQTQTAEEVSFDNFREQVTDLNSNSYGAFFFRSSFNLGHYIASSEKITIMLARLGGLFAVIYSFIEILARIYNRKKFLMSLANCLYNFMPQSKPYSEEKAVDAEGSLKKAKSVKVNFSSVLPSERISELPLSDNSSYFITANLNLNASSQTGQIKDSVFLAKVNEYLSKFRKIEFNFWSSIFPFIGKRGNVKWNTEKRLLLKKGFKKINTDLDLIQILNQGNEIEKIKNFLFNDDQRTLFEFTQKPLIKLGAPKNQQKRAAYKSRKKSSSKTLANVYFKKIMRKSNYKEKIEASESVLYKELLTAYLRIKNIKGPLKNADKKLISFLEGPMMEILEESMVANLEEEKVLNK